MVEKVQYTKSKRDQILSLIGSLKFDEHTYQDKGYEFLDVNSTFITIYHADNETRLSIELGEYFNLFFGGMQIKFAANDAEYALFINAVNGILSSLLSVYALEVEGGTKYELAETLDIHDIKEVSVIIPSFKKYKLKNAKLRTYTWNKDKNIRR